MHPSKPGNHTYGSFQAKTQEFKKKQKKIEIDRTASNDTESIQLAPRDYQKLEFWRSSKLFPLPADNRSPLAGRPSPVEGGRRKRR